MSGLGAVWLGMAGMAWSDEAGRGLVGHGKAGVAGCGEARLGAVWRVGAGEVWRGEVRPGVVGFGVAWQARYGASGCGMARCVLAGRAGHCRSGNGVVRQARRGKARHVTAGLGPAGEVGHGRAGHGLVGRGVAGMEPKRKNPSGDTRRGPIFKPKGTKMTEAPVVQIQRIAAETLLVPIVGTSSLIVHNWSDKAKRQMLDAQQGRKSPKENRDPQADYESSLYRTDDGYGFPVIGFKAATVGAARFFGKSVKMTELRQFMFFNGVPSADRKQILTPIEGEPTMREDMVRVGMGTDLRYRAEFQEWRATLQVTFVTTALSRDSVLSLIDAGGMGVGVGEWRPEKRGQNGTFALATDREVEVQK